MENIERGYKPNGTRRRNNEYEWGLNAATFHMEVAN